MPDTSAANAEARFMTAVKDQAQARSESDMQAFAAYFLPEVLAQMRATLGQAPGGRASLARLGMVDRYELLDASTDGETGRSSVRYSGYGSFVLNQEWRITENGWRVAKMERPPEMVTRPSLLQRIQRIPSNFATVRTSRPPGRGPGMMGGR